jgi:hypothetical protein
MAIAIARDAVAMRPRSADGSSVRVVPAGWWVSPRQQQAGCVWWQANKPQEPVIAAAAITAQRQRRWPDMSGTSAIIALRLCRPMVVAMLIAGCASRSETAPDLESVGPARDSADLYVGQGVGGCVGFYVVDGVVTGGFVLPSVLNLGDAAARRLSPEQLAQVGRTEAWPICRITPLGDGSYRVLALGGQRPTLGEFELVVTEVDEAALFYRMSTEDDRSGVAYSGTAINVDALATKLEASSRSSSTSRRLAR